MRKRNVITPSLAVHNSLNTSYKKECGSHVDAYVYSKLDVGKDLPCTYS